MPGAISTGIVGINANGQLVGNYTDSNFVRHGFLYDAGGFTILDVPGASPAATEFLGINASGQIVGRYVVVNGSSFHGFLYDAGGFTTLDFPGAIDTGIVGINDEGQIVGYYSDGNQLHGFVATPDEVDMTPPVITIAASPATLSPPNGRLVTVAVSGIMTDEDGGSGLQTASAVYQVTDEYGQIEPSGRPSFGPGGQYAFTVALEASRRGNDRDGRRYTIAVSATDHAGNSGSASATVTVPRK